MEISPERSSAAGHLQDAADSLSWFREDYGEALAQQIEAGDFQSWALVCQVGKSCLTDIQDGFDARLGAEIAETTTTQEGSRTDGDADKVMHRRTLGALAVNAKEKGHRWYHRSLEKSLDIHEKRDARTGAARDEVAEMNEALDEVLPDDLKLSASANRAGQAKTWVNSFALGVAVSPWSRRAPGRLLAAALYRAGAKLALRSEKGLKAKIAAQKQALETFLETAME